VEIRVHILLAELENPEEEVKTTEDGGYSPDGGRNGRYKEGSE